MTTDNTLSVTTSQSARNKPTVFRKVLKYLQNQALEQSSSKQYLTPPGREPQQRGHRGLSPSATQPRFSHTLSEASTAVERHSRSAINGSQPPIGMVSQGSSIAHNIKRVQYAHENLLQSYELFIPESSSHHGEHNKIWILYIHGGYFRDPKVDASSFRSALELLANPSPDIAEEPESESQQSHDSNADTDFFSVQHSIAGFASINYRLSPHTAYPQDPDTTPRYELRDAQWPDQINDILAALRHLQIKHNFGSRYILSGHSVGATLAYLATLQLKAAGLPPPKCVIGCNGIYDFPAIHKTNPAYESMTRNAMKPEFYAEASPALHDVNYYVKLEEQDTTNFVLSHSRDDGLVVWEQVEIMKRLLDEAADRSGHKMKVKLIETRGAHNVLWEQGKPLAMVIKEGLNMILS